MEQKFKVGHRYLVKDNNSYSDSLAEIEVLEFSPGGRIKLQYPLSNIIFWTDNKPRYSYRDNCRFEIIEDLGAINSNLKPDEEVKITLFGEKSDPFRFSQE